MQNCRMEARSPSYSAPPCSPLAGDMRRFAGQRSPRGTPRRAPTTHTISNLDGGSSDIVTSIQPPPDCARPAKKVCTSRPTRLHGPTTVLDVIGACKGICGHDPIVTGPRARARAHPEEQGRGFSSSQRDQVLNRWESAKLIAILPLPGMLQVHLALLPLQLPVSGLPACLNACGHSASQLPRVCRCRRFTRRGVVTGVLEAPRYICTLCPADLSVAKNAAGSLLYACARYILARRVQQIFLLPRMLLDHSCMHVLARAAWLRSHARRAWTARCRARHGCLAATAVIRVLHLLTVHRSAADATYVPSRVRAPRPAPAGLFPHE